MAESLARSANRTSTARAVTLDIRRGVDRINDVGTGYTRFVGFMKLFLPLIAGGLIALVVIWPQFQPGTEAFRLGLYGLETQDSGDQRLVNGRFSGTDPRNRSYSLSANSVLQVEKDSSLVDLVSPKADIMLDNGSWLALTAKTGQFHKESQILELSGSVNLFHDAGYEFRTQNAHFSLAKGTAGGNSPIEGQGPFGLLHASGFRLLDNGDRIIFTGKARLVIYPTLDRSGK